MTSNGYFINRRWKNGTTGIKWKKKKRKGNELTHNNGIILGDIEHHQALNIIVQPDIVVRMPRRRRLLRKRMHSHCCCYNCAEWALFFIFILSNTSTALATNSNKKQICHIVFPANANSIFWNWAEPKKDHIGNSNVNGTLFDGFFVFFLDFFFTCIILPLNWSHT